MASPKGWVIVAVALLLAVLLAGCGPTATPVELQPTVQATATPSGDGALEGTEWVLGSLRGESVLEGTQISLVFEGGQAGGFAGCNGYGGPYTASEGTLSVSELAVQVQLCASPQGVMEQEETYIQALLNAVNYQLINGHLQIQDDAGETILVFAQQEAYAMEPAALVGTAWQLTSKDGQEPVAGSTITLVFHDGHRASGHAGCRDYVAEYRAEEDGLRFSYLAMLGPVCPQDALLEQEGAYTTTLEWTVHYRLGENQLELLTARGETLAFRPLPEAAQASLEGPIWSLLSFVEPSPGVDIPVASDMQEGTEITILLKDSVAQGSAGCNTYRAPYALDGTSLSFETVSSTEMLCLDPEGVMDQEQRYLSILKDVITYHVYGRQLWLETADGRALVFATQDIQDL